MKDVFVHPTAIVESDQIGGGTMIWAFAHVLAGAVIGANCNIGDHCFIEAGAVVGDGVTIKNGNAIWKGLTLEDGVFVGPGATFTNDRRPRSPRSPEASDRYQDEDWLVPTVIGRGSTIGAASIVLPGANIGTYAFVAAGALVTRDVPAHALVVGRPAEVRDWVCACGYAFGVEPAEGRTLRCLRCDRSFSCDGESITGPGTTRTMLSSTSPDVH